MSDVPTVQWRTVAMIYPEFVQWVAQTHGPLPEDCTNADYTHFRAEYDKETSSERR